MNKKTHYGQWEENCRSIELKLEDIERDKQNQFAQLKLAREILGGKLLTWQKCSGYSIAMLCKIMGVNRGTFQACVDGRLSTDKILSVITKAEEAIKNLDGICQ